MGRMPESAGAWELPKLRASFGMEDQAGYTGEFYDAKFYPYSPPGSSPIFAIVLVGRVIQTKDHPFEIIRILADDDPSTYWIGCCWAKDPESEKPRLCVTGTDCNIRIFDVKDGTLVDTFIGHGDSINDVATSPSDPSIIASAADDTTVRVWSLAAVHKKQPCVALLAGEGHSWNLLTVAWHATGRYLLSAGHDQVINMWTLPEISKEHMEVPIVVHYPHFSTWAVHSNLIDCIAFLGDCILSRACYEDTIVLWRIEGFNSQNPPPSPLDAPTNYDPKKITRSAFSSATPSSCPAEYTRLLEFSVPECGHQFFMRFSVFQAPGKHPILAFCNARSKVLFWDLARLTAYHEFMTALKDPKRDKTVPIERPSWLPAKAPKKEKGDAVSKLRDPGDQYDAASEAATPDPGVAEPAMEFGPDVVAHWEGMYGVSQAHRQPLKAHKTHAVTKDLHREAIFIGRQVAWSPDGDWCIVSGNSNRALFFQRWAKDKGA
ncbi:WD domain-containing protein [Coniochaeta ligniaria NRRL 30616]|uniref:WD domain-containing protein n=1 Tax=Coniochaeta ligniaria NRRL 30616 TaxID=1408157 RepID=A0A1J7JQX0_9PEZI|nr:WD domain-containing protein [Coniochaeta ligniaria NRRL 30616]